MTQYPLWQQLNTLRQAIWVDLTHTFDPEIPRFSEFEKGEVSTLFTAKDHDLCVQRWNIVTQYGIHIDALIRFVKNKRYLEDIDLEELVLSLIVLDFSTEAANNDDFIVTRAYIEVWEKEHGTTEPGTFVTPRTDWSRHWPNVEKFENKDASGQQHAPGWGLDALKYLIEERRVEAVGHETFDTDTSVDVIKNGDLVGERYILGQDKYQVELLIDLDQLPTRGATIHAISPKPKDASGFPIRTFAIKPSND